MRAIEKSILPNIYLASSIFCDRRFSFSESLIYHLKGMGMANHEIAYLLNRDDRTIWTIYNRALKKSYAEKTIIPVRQALMIPSLVFRDRSLSIMESLIEHMKEKRQLSYHQIAAMLNRNDRTIWTIYSRTRQKRAT